MVQKGRDEPEVTAAATAATADAPDAHANLRRCIVTREALEKDRLIRFVLGPDDSVVPDLAKTLPGRGAWVKAERKVLAEAVKRNAFARTFEAPAKPAADLVERIAIMLDRQILDLLGLAKRSGQLVTGFEKVNVALMTGRAVLLIEASDAGKDGRGKLARHTHPGVEIWSPLTAEALGRAIGRNHAVHVAVGPGGIARRLQVALRRQRGFSDPAANAADSSAPVAGMRGKPEPKGSAPSGRAPTRERTE
jgi:predicted RNA-binding protein YlxR (DUF448 family)/ribosomal protein L30E